MFISTTLAVDIYPPKPLKPDELMDLARKCGIVDKFSLHKDGRIYTISTVQPVPREVRNRVEQSITHYVGICTIVWHDHERSSMELLE